MQSMPTIFPACLPKMRSQAAAGMAKEETGAAEAIWATGTSNRAGSDHLLNQLAQRSKDLRSLRLMFFVVNPFFTTLLVFTTLLDSSMPTVWDEMFAACASRAYHGAVRCRERAVPEIRRIAYLTLLRQKGGSMIRLLLFCAMLFQASTQATLKPSIDNDRVTVRDASVYSVTAQPLDAVVVSASGVATFVPKGATAKLSGHLLVIDLKDHPVPPIENKTGYPLGFPRPGSKKLLENARVIVWDYSWQPGVPTPMHFHDKDVVAWFLEDGDLSSTTPDG